MKGHIAASWLLLALTTGCARGLYGPSIDTPVDDPPRELDELSVSERRALLDRAQVWRDIDTASLDLLAGPRADDGFAYDELVTCAFHFPDEPVDGMTPKFECELPDGDVVKVKYGETNGEVFAEVAGTRLFWALGLAVDRMYPVRVNCLNCPADPYLVSSSEWRFGKPGNVRARLFDVAAIERKIDGESVEVDDYDGWSWRELEAIADNDVGAPRAHIDALKLLAAFVQHVDSKPDNQSIVCPERRIGKDAEGNETCSEPLLVVKDLGSTFAAASKLTFPKMKLASWRSARLWRNKATCQANLTSSIVGTLSHPTVSEAGRAFLAERLGKLSDRQLRDLFTAARVERWKDTIDGRQATPDDWVRVFKDKRAELTGHRCAR